MNSMRTIWLLMLSAVLAGCRPYTGPVPAANYYYLNRGKDISAVGSVALVELYNDSSYPQVGGDVTEALYEALQKKQVFSLSVVNRSEPAWRGLQAHLDDGYSLEQLSAIRKTLKVNAVLVGTVTQYRPYPHMAAGLRLKLLDLKDGQLLWAFEQIWDTADKTTQQRIKSYFERQMRSGFAPMREELAAVSSINFIKFVVFEAAETLSSGVRDNRGYFSREAAQKNIARKGPEL